MSSLPATKRGPRPSAAVDAATWERAHTEVVETLRDLIRIPSVNPPDPPGGELAAARHIGAILEDAGLRPEILEPVPGRGSVAARIRGDGTGGEPLLLLSHLDVVPAPPELWTHDPFAADLANGAIYGRGAVDMKGMIALELGVVRRLAAEARAAGRDPASDPIPGLRRDILFVSTADEEAGGQAGAAWIVEHRPELLRAAGALNESGGVSWEFDGRRFYPIGVAEKGYVTYHITVHGTWGHGSMPRDDNAAVRAGRIAAALATTGPIRLTPAMTRFLDLVAEAFPGATGQALAALAVGGDRAEAAERLLERMCDPTSARVIRALIRDTVSPNIIRAGLKYNVIPGVAEIEVDCRTLPGTTTEELTQALRGRIGEELAATCEIEPYLVGPAVEAPLTGDLYPLLVDTLVEHDPDAIPVPVMLPFATDAKHAVKLGVPTYGFSPMRLGSTDRFLDLFHAVDERVPVEGLRFGLPVLYDVVRRFCG